ncbi:hypothetical protein [Streptomyces scabiei]|uniref:hypothetical protein n=1 Tax=Streptomyces scabiei TaxID=1930 RepID=UPI001B313D4E|nr:hypothetical protein [Streptomyces sp. LBUM 1475]
MDVNRAGQPVCPLCGKPLDYSGDVDSTAIGHEGRERRRGVYKCKSESCDNFETVVNPD